MIKKMNIKSKTLTLKNVKVGSIIFYYKTDFDPEVVLKIDYENRKIYSTPLSTKTESEKGWIDCTIFNNWKLLE